MKHLPSLLFVLSVFIFISCKKQPPVACITADRTDNSIDSLFTFYNCSTGADRVVWDFGDGTQQEGGDSARHAYSTVGPHLVTLKAYSKKDKLVDKASLIANVPPPMPLLPPLHRYLNRVVLTAFPSTKTGGATWDATINTAPDLIIRLHYTDNTWGMQTNVIQNAQATSVPATYSFAPNNILLTDANWAIDLLDDDSPMTGGAGGMELMASFTDNLGIAAADSSNKIVFSGSGAQIEIYFDLR